MSFATTDHELMTLVTNQLLPTYPLAQEMNYVQLAVHTRNLEDKQIPHLSLLTKTNRQFEIS